MLVTFSDDDVMKTSTYSAVIVICRNCYLLLINWKNIFCRNTIIISYFVTHANIFVKYACVGIEKLIELNLFKVWKYAILWKVEFLLLYNKSNLLPLIYV